ncbi:MAG: DUF1573 domain-containing protein [Candidatus Zixiibacteriota bacterium]
MKKVLLLSLLLASVAFAVPKMQLPEETFDFGYVPQSSKVTHTFWIKSVGDETLNILNVKPGCGCTKAPLKSDKIVAGDSTELEIIYSTGMHVGQSTKRPTITTNEGPPDRRVTIKANAVREPDSTYPVIISPYKLMVSKAGEIDVDEVDFSITNVSDQALDLSLVSIPAGYFSTELPTSIPAGQSARCKLKVKPDHLDETFEKSLTLQFNDPGKSRFTIPIVRRLIGATAQATTATQAIQTSGGK